MKTPRPVVLLIASLFATSNAFAIGSDAVASGAAAAGGDPLSSVTASAPPVPPLPSIVTGVDEIAALIPQAVSMQVDLSVPGIGEMQSGKGTYVSGKPTCSTQQLTAEKICREKTNPELQKTAMVINGLVSGMNALNDSCSTSSKVMGLASAALTGYTVTCGALRYRCEQTCATTGKAVAQIQAGLAKGAFCKPINPLMAANCGIIIGKYNAAAARVSAGLKEEMNVADITTVAGRTKVCTHDYMLLLGSAALGIMSTAKAFAQTSKCDKDTKADSGGSAGSGAAASTAAAAASSAGTAATSASPTPIGIVPITSQASVNYVGNASAAGEAATGAGANDAKVGLAAASKAQDRGVAADSPYRAFLPGGEKDPNKAVAGAEGNLVTPREITSANGKNNFEKIRESFRKQSKSLIVP